MINILKRKPVIIGLIALVVVALVVPVATVSAAGLSSAPQLSRAGDNVTSVQGVISSITNTGIVITVMASDGTTSQVSLAFDGNTNFNIHGIDWLNGSLVGKTVSAIYKNNQTVNPPVASQMTINMPKPTAPVPPVNKNGAMVQGTIASISGNTITITLGSTGAGTLAANQMVVIVPSPVQGTQKSFTGEQGTVTSISGNTLTITLSGTSTTALTVGQTVVIGPSPANVLKNFTREQGTVTSISGNTVAITLTGNGTTTLTTGQTVIIVPSPVQGTQKNFTGEQGTVASISGNTLTITLTGTGTTTLTVGQAVDIGPGMMPGMTRPQTIPGGKFGGFPQSRF